MASTTDPKKMEDLYSLAPGLEYKELVTQVSSNQQKTEDSLIKIIKTVNALRVVVLLIGIVLSVVIVIKGIMAIWYTVFNDQFWVVIAGMVCACAGKTVNSRCRSVSICGPRGCLSFERGREPDNLPQPIPATVPGSEPPVDRVELTPQTSEIAIGSPEDRPFVGYRLPSDMPPLLSIPPPTDHYNTASPVPVSPITSDERIQLNHT